MTGRALRWTVRTLAAVWGWRIDRYNARHWDQP